PPTFTWPTVTATDLRLGRGAAASIMSVSSALQGSARQQIWRQTRARSRPHFAVLPSRSPLAVRAGAGDLDHRQGRREAGAAGGGGERLSDVGGRGLAHRPAALADQERDQRIGAVVAPTGHA